MIDFLDTLNVWISKDFFDEALFTDVLDVLHVLESM